MSAKDSSSATVDSAWKNYEHIQGQIAMADNKAQILLGVNGLLLTVAGALNKGSLVMLFSPLITIQQRLSTAFTMIMIILLVISLYLDFRVVAPTLVAPKTKSLFYFGSIAILEEKEFIRAFKNQDTETLLTALLAEVYIKSVIALRKYKRLRGSLYALMAALGCWVAGQILLAIA